MALEQKKRAPRNQTLQLTPADRKRLLPGLLDTGKFLETNDHLDSDKMPSGIVCGDSIQLATALPHQWVDLLFLDPPYNLAKSFGKSTFRKQSIADYTCWLDATIKAFVPLLKPTATIYICGDWHTSHSIFEVADRHFTIRNRITWEREKGRGARSNWKNNSEDIWFCTMSEEYTFHVDDVKQRRPVIAPYRNADRTPKDWSESKQGKFRDTHPSNLWTDITIPFWSMPENTDHPTQKSEKLLARLILASTGMNDFVFDPFVGSGTSCVVARKLGRRYLGIEQETEFALLAARRLEIAGQHKEIQGYRDGVFWSRNAQRNRSNRNDP